MGKAVDLAQLGSYDPPGQVTLTAPTRLVRGTATTVATTVSVPYGAPAVQRASLTLKLPDGWTVAGEPTVSLGQIQPGRIAGATWRVTPPPGEQPWSVFLQAVAILDGKLATGGQSVTVVPSPPTGTVYVSDLPFQAINGWGPVERDQSNGENGAGDGHPITLDGVVHPKGLGAHPASDITLYPGGACTRFTAVVGIDAEVGSHGSTTFSVISDGYALTTTPVLTGGTSMHLDVDITGARQLDLVVGDGGDGPAYDHSDWADAQLTCATNSG
jgi:hypothetical protein